MFERHYLITDPIRYVEASERNQEQTGVTLSGLSCQEAADFLETLNTSWAEALPFVPGQRYHSDCKFL